MYAICTTHDRERKEEWEVKIKYSEQRKTYHSLLISLSSSTSSSFISISVFFMLIYAFPRFPIIYFVKTDIPAKIYYERINKCKEIKSIRESSLCVFTVFLFSPLYFNPEEIWTTLFICLYIVILYYENSTDGKKKQKKKTEIERIEITTSNPVYVISKAPLFFVLSIWAQLRYLFSFELTSLRNWILVHLWHI